MKLRQIQKNIEGYSSDQLGHHNNNCNSKLHTTVEERISQVEADIVDDTIAAIELLSETDFNTLNGDLPATRKLSHFPC